MAKGWQLYTAVLILFTGIFSIHYGMERHETALLLSTYALVFGAYLWLLRNSRLQARMVLVVAVFLRITLFFAWPTLSDDIYRFLWDGHLLQAGIHPFSATPQDIYNSGVIIETLDSSIYQKLNSPDYFTIYPPLSQLTFWIAAWMDDLFWGMTIVRVLLFAGEVLTLWLIFLYFDGKNKPNRLAIYGLNPLIVLEVTGNLHYEGLMVSMVLIAIIAMKKGNTIVTSIAFALGVGIKLVPLIFLPSLIRKTGLRRSIVAYVLIGSFVILMFLPLINYEMLTGMTQSLSLFFRKFEFNAGPFFLIRQIGLWLLGYDVVQTAGPVLSIFSFVAIWWLSLRRVSPASDMAAVFALILLVQLLCSVIVHPWYLIPLIAFASVNGYKFPVYWSFLAFLSYAGYAVKGYDHPMTLIAIEYLSLGYLVWREVILKRKQPWVANV